MRANNQKDTSLSIIERQDFQQLFDQLANLGYQLIGPTVRGSAVVYDEIHAVSDLPIGYTDEQEAGVYRLHKGETQQVFGCGLSPHAWKQFLFPPVVRMWQARQSSGGFEIVPESHLPRQLAFIGVRACELKAIAIQDRVFMEGAYADPIYQQQREQIFILAVNCGRANATCFCASMDAGPRAKAGFDLALTEVMEPDHHYFVVEAGSERGEEALRAVPHRPAAKAEAAAAEGIIAQTAAQMRRQLDTRRIKDLLYASYEHPRWDQVAARCLMCGNCTQACPTCFCTTFEDVTELDGASAERRRVWDTCFSLDFSYVVGGSVRASAKARYRQWMVHKLATWIDQFGSSGCVGCGRCITWCPVGIDITEEAAAIRAETPGKKTPAVTEANKHEHA
jgi:ferredoxin